MLGAKSDRVVGVRQRPSDLPTAWRLGVRTLSSNNEPTPQLPTPSRKGKGRNSAASAEEYAGIPKRLRRWERRVGRDPAQSRRAPSDGEDGYAIVAAVAALAVFAAIAYAVLAAGRGDLADLRGEAARARLDAAADAGLAQAVQGLATDDVTRRWAIDGRARTLSFNGARLTIVVEDERGKTPLAGLNDDQLRRLFTGAGVTGERVGRLVDAYQDWLDPDADPRRHAAELAAYAARGLKPPDVAGLSVDEFARLNGMDPVTFARIRRVLTPYFGNGGPFTPKTASPLAIAVMSEAGDDDPEVLERQRELAGQVPALDIAGEKSMSGHAVTIAVRAEDPAGDRAERRTVVVFTGKSAPAFFIRQSE